MLDARFFRIRPFRHSNKTGVRAGRGPLPDGRGSERHSRGAVHFLALSLLPVVVCPVAGRASIVGEIVHVGFPAVLGIEEGRNLIRPGEWMPVVVRLRLEGEESFDGWLRVSQPDQDGDLVYDLQRISLLRDQVRTYSLYVVAGRSTGRPGSVTVDVINSGNERVALTCNGESAHTLAPAAAPVALGPDDWVVLSVGPSVGKVIQLESLGGTDALKKSVQVAHLAAEDLPTQWQALQSVDAVVWDRADPTELSAAQLQAIIEWTRQGGSLVVAAGATVDAVKNRLDDILPVDIGSTVSTPRLKDFRRYMLGLSSDEDGPEYESPIVIAHCKPREGATVILNERIGGGDSGAEADFAIVTQRRLNRGRVTFVAGALAELLGAGGNVVNFYRRILELRIDPYPTGGGFDVRDLSDVIDGWIGFTQVGATYLAVAMLFAAGYVFAATFGSWQFLRTRGWLNHSWSAFAVVSVLASGICVVGVQAVRGVGKDLVQLTVVDMEAGSSVAGASAYFGLKTSLFGEWDVWLPSDYPQQAQPEPGLCFLTPLPPKSNNMADRHYADPRRYRSMPSRAELLGVPIRGTLKQFSGHWSGVLSGSVQANVQMIKDGPGGKYDWRVSPDSTITNRLGVDLYQSWLIYATSDIFVANLTQDQSRADKVFLFPLGPVANGEAIKPGATLYVNSSGEDLLFSDWKDQTLEKALVDVGSGLGGIGLGSMGGGSGKWELRERHEKMLFLASFFSEFSPEPTGTFSTTWTMGHARQLDISHLLDTGTAVFVGMAADDGPVNLCTGRDGDYQRVNPERSSTMYRVLIPLNTRTEESN